MFCLLKDTILNLKIPLSSVLKTHQKTHHEIIELVFYTYNSNTNFYILQSQKLTDFTIN